MRRHRCPEAARDELRDRRTTPCTAACRSRCSYDPNSKTAGPLLGDALLRGIESQIGVDLSNPVAGVEGDYKTLASLGITRQTDGTLKLDDAKLNKALAADRQSVQKVFGSGEWRFQASLRSPGKHAQGWLRRSTRATMR